VKVHRFKRLSAVVAVAATAAVVLAGCGGGSAESASSSGSGDGKSLNVWWYESSDSAMGIAWNKALEEFKAAHPDVTVNFELKSWDQIQQSGSMVLNSDSTPM
jgi:raffinose/stachyose/melibiose transport system substrate-binding protein